jgi:hypothetical protein
VHVPDRARKCDRIGRPVAHARVHHRAAAGRLGKPAGERATLLPSRGAREGRRAWGPRLPEVRTIDIRGYDRRPRGASCLPWKPT